MSGEHGLPTASVSCVRRQRRPPAAVDNPAPLSNRQSSTYRTPIRVQTDGATSQWALKTLWSLPIGMRIDRCVTGYSRDLLDEKHMGKARLAGHSQFAEINSPRTMS